MSETALAFVLLYIGGLLLSIFVRPSFGLYTYIATFYVHPPSRWWGESLPDVRWALVAAVVTLFSIWLSNSKQGDSQGPSWTGSLVTKCVILYTVWMWVQLPWVASPYHMEGVVLFSKYVLLLYLIIKVVDSVEEFERFCLINVLGCAYFGYLVFIAPDAGRLEGVGGPGVDDANSLGMHLAAGLIFASFVLISAKGKARLVVLVAIPLILNGLIQTETRGAIVGLGVGAIATMYLKPHKIRRLYYGLAAIAIVGVLVVANEAFLGRMSTLRATVDESSEWDNSAQSRLEIIKGQLEMFKDYPLGVGHQGTAALSANYLDERWLASNSGNRSSHNTVMSILVDQGVIGIVIFLVLSLSVCKNLVRLKKLDKQGLPVKLGLYRALVGGAIFSIIGSGMFAQNLKAEILYWTIGLFAVMSTLTSDWQRERMAEQLEE